jgi:hypothetical protein
VKHLSNLRAFLFVSCGSLHLVKLGHGENNFLGSRQFSLMLKLPQKNAQWLKEIPKLSSCFVSINLCVIVFYLKKLKFRREK